MHIAHGLLETFLTFFKFFSQILYLKVQNLYIPVKGIDVTTDAINRPTLVTDLRIDDHQVLQAFLHVLLILAQLALLLLHLLLELLALALQPFHRHRLLLLGGRDLLGRLFSRLFLGYSLRCSGLFSDSGLFLSGNGHYNKTKQQENNLQSFHLLFTGT